MASRQPNELPKQAKPGDLLLVLHAFEARSPDELTFAKGDKIELIERDDDFGDGWYLGKHVGDGRTGLFPEVYTKLAPQDTQTAMPAPQQVRPTRASSTPNAPPAFSAASKQAPSPYDAQGTTDGIQESEKKRPASETAQSPSQAHHSSFQVAPSPLNTSQSQRTVSVPSNAFTSPTASSAPPTQRSISLMMEGGRNPDESSPVMHETLSVINEHITDMNTPRSSLFAAEPRRMNDSGSDYSGHPAQRMSYINGNETDEEEQNAYSEAEVRKWNADQVAEVLEDIGVEKRHCEIFLEQEISGEVLLELDQASVFMKEFDLGVVGRRLRTWQKIKSFQDEVRADHRSLTQRRKDNRLTPTGSVNGRHMYPGSPLAESYTPDSAGDAEGSTRGFKTSGSRHSKTGSRDHGHVRRLSSMDSQNKPHLNAPESEGISPHTKKPSLDRNWTMGSNSPVNTRSSFLGVSNHSQTASTVDFEGSSDGGARDNDRGYQSGSELDGKKHRNVLKKREASSASHSRQSSVQNLASPPATKRHSRFGSASSFIASLTGKSQDDSVNKQEQADIKDARMFGDSPVVTKLDYDTTGTSVKPQRESRNTESSQWTLVQPGATRPNTELSNIRGEDKMSLSATLVSSPLRDSTSRETATQPPSRADSNATSGGNKSMDAEHQSRRPGSGMPPTLTPSASATRRGTKSKKQTSAYTRGLLKITPREAMAECDYSGWMKKKSPSLIATWKPRLFVLRGRRLSYYYSENDAEEQGLIDISNHKVLPADDVLTGIHATVTGAKATPTSPANAQTETMNEAEAAAQIDSTLRKHPTGTSGIFIFKLVPPRAGLSRAVNFTKPTVHYFAVDNIKQGRLWMAALMKATIQLDSSKSVVTTYGQKTISLEKAKAMRQRPPNLQDAADDKTGAPATAALGEGDDGDDEREDDDAEANSQVDDSGLNISGLNLSYEYIATEANRAESRANGDEIGPASAPLDSRAALAGAGRSRQSTPARDAKNSLRLVRSLSGGISNRSGNQSRHRPQGPDEFYENDEDDNTDDLSRVSTNASGRTPGNNHHRARAMSGGTVGTAGSIDATFASVR